MKVEIIVSPTGEDVMLKLIHGSYKEVDRIVATRQELHQIDWAIRKHLEEQPSRNLKEATGK